MRKNDILFLIISSFVFIFAWIFFHIYHNYKTSTISESTNIQIIPIVPRFDTKTIDLLKQRAIITPVLSGFGQPSNITIATKSASASPSATPVPTGTTQQASASGNLGL